jgi:hypothetical protein
MQEKKQHAKKSLTFCLLDTHLRLRVAPHSENALFNTEPNRYRLRQCMALTFRVFLRRLQATEEPSRSLLVVLCELIVPPLDAVKRTKAKLNERALRNSLHWHENQ